MPARTKQQFKYIWAMRRKYKSKKKAPKRMKWVFDREWTDVDFKSLPERANEGVIMRFHDWVEATFNK